MKSEIVVPLVSFVVGGGLIKVLDLILKSNKSNYINPKTDALAFRRSLLKDIENLKKKEEKNEATILQLVQDNALMKGRFESLTRENAELVALLHKRMDTTQQG